MENCKNWIVMIENAIFFFLPTQTIRMRNNTPWWSVYTLFPFQNGKNKSPRKYYINNVGFAQILFTF